QAVWPSWTFLKNHCWCPDHDERDWPDMDLREFASLFEGSLLGRMPSDSKTSGVFVTGEVTFFGFIWDRDVCRSRSWAEEFNAHVQAAKAHRLPFLAMLPSSIEDEVDGTSVATMKMAVLEAKEVIP